MLQCRVCGATYENDDVHVCPNCGNPLIPNGNAAPQQPNPPYGYTGNPAGAPPPVYPNPQNDPKGQTFFNATYTSTGQKSNIWTGVLKFCAFLMIFGCTAAGLMVSLTFRGMPTAVLFLLPFAGLIVGLIMGSGCMLIATLVDDVAKCKQSLRVVSQMLFEIYQQNRH